MTVEVRPIGFAILATERDGDDALIHVRLANAAPLRFKTPSVALRVSDADGDGIFVATDSFSTVYGEGDDPTAAIEDYLRTLLERYLDLERDVAILAPGLQRDLATLRQHITRTS
jgi:hypothetical protein